MDTYWNSSYVFAVDSRSGWGPRYYFSYYSEFDPTRTHGTTLEVTFFVIIFLTSVLANTSIIVCVVRYSDMKTATNCFILNLALADLVFTLTIPAVAYTRIVQSWQLGESTCKTIPYVQFVSGIVLLYTMALISKDRHSCVVIPPYRSRITFHRAIMYSVATWIITAVFFVPVPLWFREITSTDNCTKICTLVFPKISTFQISIFFLIPVVFFACCCPISLLCYFYQSICQKIISTRDTWASSCVVVSVMDIKGCNRHHGRRQSELSMSDIFVPWPRRFSSQMIQVPSGRQGSLSHQEEARKNKHLKVLRIVLLNMFVEFTMWTPITVIMVLIYFDGNRELDDRNFFLRSHHFIYSLLIAFLNTLINPIIYGLGSENFRSFLLKLWCCTRNDPEQSVEPLTISSGRIVNNNDNNNSNGVRTSRKQSSISSLTEQ